ncbi:MAG: cell filamentation protein Fic, partial [Endomicrobium sp.]|nr:cell filamentation protein Fic [Endomicrobium sp.]
MASSQIKLAESLQKLKKFQNDNGVAVIRFTDLSRVHLKRLLKNGFLQEVLKGWYVSSRPDNAIGDTTNWFTAYWSFIANYANSRFGKNWCLSAEQSLSFHSGNKTVPRQIIIRTAKGSNNIQELLHNTSILY